MGLLDSLVFNVDADLTRYHGKMRKVGREAHQAAQTMTRGFRQVTDGIGQMVNRLTLVGGATIGLATVGANNYEHAMARARTMTDLSAESWSKLSDKVRSALVDNGIKDFALAGEATFSAFSAGAKDSDEALDLVTLGFENFQSQGTAVKETIEFITQQWKVYGRESGNAVDQLDLLSAATVRAKDTQEGFAASLRGITPLAKASGLTQFELFGGVADLSQALGGANEAATAFREILNANLTPTRQQAEAVEAINRALLRHANITDEEIDALGGAEKAAAKYNVELVKLGKTAIPEAGGLVPFLERLTRGMTLTDESTRRLVRSVEGFNALLAVAESNASELDDTINFLSGSSGRHAQNMEIMAQTTQFAFDQAVASLKEVGLTLVTDTGLLEDMKRVLEFVVTGLKDLAAEARAWIEANPEGVQALKDQALEWGKVAGMIVVVQKAIAFVAPLFTVLAGAVIFLKGAAQGLWAVLKFGGLVLKGLGIALAFLTSPIGLVVAAVGGLVAAFVVFWDEIKAGTAFVIDVLTGWVDDTIGLFTDILNGIQATGAAIFEAITGWFGRAADWVIEKWDSVLEWFASLPGKVGDFFGFNQGGFVGDRVPGFAEGGFVEGTGGRDAITAKVTRGEFVVNPTSTAIFGPLLAAINALGNNLHAGALSAPSGGASRIEVHIHAYGDFDEALAQRVVVPALERIEERGLSPREPSLL